MKNYARVAQGVDIWSWNLIRTMETDIIPSLRKETIQEIFNEDANFFKGLVSGNV